MKLNKIERLKQQLKPSQYYDKIDTIDPANIDEADRFYLKNFGIYNNKLRPDEWMVRIRIPGGRIAKEALKTIKALAKEYNAQTILTARSQIELQKLNFHQALEAHKLLKSAGITTFAVLTDNIRNILTDPFDGLTENGFYETYPLICKMNEIAIDPNLLGMLPRKFNVAILGNPATKVSFFAQDLFFAPAKKEERFGFNVYWGGKNTETAKEADIFIEPDDVVAFYKSVVECYIKIGPRQSRTKARLYHLLLQEPDFRQKVEEKFGKELQRAGELLIERYDSVPKLKNSLSFQTFGEYGYIDLQTIDLERYDLFRLGPDQKLYAFYRTKPDAFEEFATVCAGSRYCVYSLFDTKDVIRNILTNTNLPKDLRINLSGCLKGCGRHILADIGFVGIRTNQFGAVERGVRLYLGGEYTLGKQPARLIYWAVPLRKLPQLLEVIIDDFYQSGRKNFEEYAKSVLGRFSEEFLAYFFLAKAVSGQKVPLANLKSETDPFGLLQGSLHESIKTLEYRYFGEER